MRNSYGAIKRISHPQLHFDTLFINPVLRLLYRRPASASANRAIGGGSGSLVAIP